MRNFAALYTALEASTLIRAKQAALDGYFADADDADAAWAVYFLSGGKPRQLVPTKTLRTLAQQVAALPVWLFEESYSIVGDLAETISLLLPPPSAPATRPLHVWMRDHLLPLRGLDAPTQEAALRLQWQEVPLEDRFVYLKLITGAFRVGVSRLQVIQALARRSGLDAKLIAQRLMGYTKISGAPDADAYRALIAANDTEEKDRAGRLGHPYPFFLAQSLNEPVDKFSALIGAVSDWQVEWKWDGIRAQLVRRGGAAWLWSRGEDFVNDQFPELIEAAASLPDGTVLDGEILVWDAANNRPAPFADLQKRLGRKSLTAKILADIPVALIAYDLLEIDGEDWRNHEQHVRRSRLEALLAASVHPRIHISPLIRGESWADLAELRTESRARGTEGFMLKRNDSKYGVGRTRADGLWFKWKIDPMTVDAVLIYAQRGHGRRASLYSDYTFAVWSGAEDDPERTLVPFAKAYSGLTDAEMRQVDAIVRKTTKESFGPVRSVTPTQVFELGFEGIAPSGRHKSGIAVRFPRMLRWRQDKPVAEADTMAALQALLPQ